MCKESFEYYKVLLKIGGEAAAFLRDHACEEAYGRSVRGDTIRADLEAEDYIVDIIKSEGLRGVIITEERGRIDLGSDNLLFIIDPLDGSTNYKHCVPWCNISIALFTKNNNSYEEVAGVIAPIFYGDPIGFAKGCGCFEGMSRIEAKNKGNLVLVYADEPQSLPLLSELIVTIKEKYKNPKLRSLGSAALELAYTAMGRSIAFADFRGSLRNVDVASALGMLRECGGIALDLEGKDIEVISNSVMKIGTIIASLDKDLVLTYVNRIKERRRGR